MNYTFGICNVLAVLIGSLIALFEGRFDHAQMGPKALPWLNHGGTWADLVLVSIIMALVMSYWSQWKSEDIVKYGIICGLISVAFHLMWAKTMPIASHIVEPKVFSQPVGFYYHLLYTWVVLTPIVLFYFATPPGASKFWVSLLLTIYLPVAVMQPGWYVNKVVHGQGKIDLMAWAVTGVVLVLIWGVGYRRP